MQFSFRYTPAVLTALLGITVTVSLFIYVQRNEETETQQRFEKHANSFIEMIENDLESQIHTLESVATFFGASELVDRFSFYTFVTPLYKRSAALQAIEWVPEVKHKERMRYETFAQNDGFPDFHFTQKTPLGKSIPARYKANYYPVFYVEPYRSNEEMLGFDLGSDKTWRKTIKQVIKNKMPTLSETVVHAHGTAEQASVLLMVPIFRNTLKQSRLSAPNNTINGLIVGDIRVDILFNNLAAKYRHNTNYLSNIHINLFDMDENDSQRLILSKSFTSTSPNTSKADRTSSSRTVHQINFGNRKWHAVITSSDDKERMQARIQALKAALTSFLFFSLITVYLIRIIQEKTEIQRLNQEKDLSLNAHHQQLTDILNSIPEGLITFDQKGLIQSVNHAAERIFAYSRSEIIGRNISQLIPDLTHEDSVIPFKMLVPYEKTTGFETGREMDGVKKGGSFLMLDVALTSIGLLNPPLYACVIKDTSEVKKYERAQTDALTVLRQELNTSLTAIRGALDIITTSTDDQLSDKSKRMMDSMKKNSERLSHFINTLLEIKK
jgi:PAS domain S-box-containing protein